MRVLPLENEAVNECWLSDKDRFSYEGLNTAERLTRADDPREGVGTWREVDWQQALAFVAEGLKRVATARRRRSGRSPRRTRRSRSCSCCRSSCAGWAASNVDFRLRQADFAADGKRKGAPWLGMKIADIGGARPRARRRLVPAQGPSADRAAAFARRRSAGSR